MGKTSGDGFDFNSARSQQEAEANARGGGVDAADIRARLHADPTAFVKWLFSGRAICSSREARIANVSGAAGESLGIKLTGPEAGLWYDHATGEGGDLIDLFCAWRGYVKGSNFQLALKEIARDFLGDKVKVDAPAWQKTTRETIDEKKRTLGTKPREENIALGAPVDSYEYFDRDGRIIAVVRRYEPGGVDALGKPNKTFRASPGFPSPRPLYRIPQIVQASHVVLTEGERKANALATLGIEATSAMGGANTKLEMVDWSVLAGKIVTIWPDKDEAGFAYAGRVAAVLLSLGCTVGIVEPPADRPAKWDAFDCVRENGDAWGLINAARPVAGQAGAETGGPEQPSDGAGGASQGQAGAGAGAAGARPSRIRLVSLRELESMPALQWLVEGILPAGGMSMLWGRSGSLKSFVALDFCMCVSTALAWHGKAVRRGRAIYVAAEGAAGLAQRAIGWREVRGRELGEPDLLLVPHGLTLAGDDVTEMILAIAAAGVPPALIVIDTMSRTFAGNPNQPVDMNAYVAAADRLRLATGAHVMIVHHAGEDEEKNEIGNKGLRNACDTVIFVKRTGDKVKLVNEAPKGKQKDAEEFKTIGLRPVKVSYMLKDEERSTLLLNLDEDAEEDAEEADGGGTVRFGVAQKAILKALEEAGEPLGLTRLQAMTNRNKGTIYTALYSLAEKGLIENVRAAGGKYDLWQIKNQE